MPEDSAQEKTEPATQHRRDDARKKGQVARSSELNSFAILFFGTLFLLFAGPSLAHNMATLMREMLAGLATPPSNTGEFVGIVVHLGIRVLLMLAPLFMALISVAIVVNGAQVGFRSSPEALQPKFDKLDLVKGAKRLFSGRSLVELIRDILKLCIIGVVAYFAVDAERAAFLELSDANAVTILSVAGWAIFRVGIKIILALLALALGDYAFQKFEFERSIRMTKQEVKEELHQQEGSPQVRARIRQVQRELARMRMTQEIPKADVVVTNPTRLAVALKYDVENMAAPVLLAKGARMLADKIRRIARDNGIPIVENKPLARAIYASVEVGATIPADLYKATAEVLAYVYRLRGDERMTAGSHGDSGTVAQ